MTLGLLVVQWNCRSMYRKLHELKQHVQSLQGPPDIFMIQETHLCDKYTLQIPGYTAERKDKSIHGKGPATLIRDYNRFVELSTTGRHPVEMQLFEAGEIKQCNILHTPG